MVLLLLSSGCGALTSYQGFCDTALVTAWADADGDGFGDPATAVEGCGVPAGSVSQGGDCDDTVASQFPGNVEECDDLDNDCNDAVDDGLPEETYFADSDGDGFGDPETPVSACGPLPGRVVDDTDCDDGDPANSPGFTEICDGGDNDCDDLVDDEDDSVDPSSMLDWYRDDDGDGFGDGAPVERCAAGGPYTTNDDGDCDETDAGVNPAASEVCGGGDEDCDGLTDDADSSVDPGGFSSWYPDTDRDGYGDAVGSLDACAPPNNYAGNDDDCDDTRAVIGPEQDWWSDADQDGYGNGVSLGPACPPAVAGTLAAGGPVDCDDNEPLEHPGNPEVCGDGLDNDCSGADAQCPPVGFYNVHTGPFWQNDPPVFSCLEACALVFGGVDTDYYCSTSGVVVDHLAFASGWGDASTCINPVGEGFSAEPGGNPGYNCGSIGCAYSAYVQDNCTNNPINWCWPR